jgi:hypothetical protein
VWLKTIAQRDIISTQALIGRQGAMWAVPAVAQSVRLK